MFVLKEAPIERFRRTLARTVLLPVLTAFALLSTALPASAHTLDEAVRSSAGCKWSGGGYSVLDSDAVRLSSGTRVGSVYLLWSGTYQQNCVVTLRTGAAHGVVGTTAAYLYIQTSTGYRSEHDIDAYAHFAAVPAATRGVCVGYEGSVAFGGNRGFGGRGTQWDNCG